MARARNIKPGFFKNDQLAECHPLARILFAGLWCEADRAGRLEDRPKRLKVEILPYDDCDIETLLGQLAGRRFIVRYEVDGVRYIAIPEFAKHQNPHIKEAASTIPPPVEKVPVPAAPVPAPEGPVQAPDKHCASTVQAPDEPGLSLDSLSLDSPSQLRAPTPNGVGVPGDAGDLFGGQVPDTKAGVKLAKAPVPACPHEEILAEYHRILPMCTPHRTWSEGRQAMLRSRWREDSARQSVEWWTAFFEFVADCPWLVGKVQPRDDRPPFTADLEWLVRPTNFNKVLDGKYQRGGA